METKFLLSHLNLDAVAHGITSLPTANTDDCRKIKKLLGRSAQGVFESENFADTEIDIANFDWHSRKMDDNWWWQVQQLPFLNWYRGSYELLNPEEKENFSYLCLDAIFNWIRHAKNNTSSPMAWQDQGSAFRLRHLVMWLLFLQVKQASVLNDIRIDTLGEIIVEHLDWLHDDKNYSKNTNHGFDQALTVVYVTAMFNCNDIEPYRQKNRKRLMDEISHAFTEEGVHIENSPAYQKYMLSQLRQLRSFALLGEHDLAALGDTHILKAETFLRAITLPNGLLPLIGDTKGQDKGLVYKQESTIDVLDYSRSGYVIVRGTVLGRDFHLIFKASHLSHYHRHDDDLSMHIYFNGEVVLGDGGLGNYHENNPKRISLRSYLAHNIPFVENAEALRRISEPFRRPRVFLGDRKIFGESLMYGILLKREVCFAELAQGKIHIKDYAASPHKKISSNFYSPLATAIDSGHLHVDTNGGKVTISPNKTGNFESCGTYFSEEYGEFIDTKCYAFHSESNVGEFLIALMLD